MFLFAAERESHVSYLPARDLDLPTRGEAIDVPADLAFAHNFDLAKAVGRTAGGPLLIRRWARLRGHSRLHELIQMLLVADVLPASVMNLANRPGPICTMTWQLDIITPSPRSDDGWWLVSAEASVAQRGFSSQAMEVWNSEGDLVATARQTIALFV
jgi:hypothetical protein